MTIRRGISLIELLLVMSAASVVLTMSASLIHRLMHVQTQASSIVDAERTALRLGDAFRHDVHQATRVIRTSAEGVLVRFQMPDDQTIEYRSEPQAVRRIVSKAEQIVSRERFGFPMTIHSAAAANHARLVTLQIRSISDSPLKEEQPDDVQDSFADLILYVEAMLNRDNR